MTAGTVFAVAGCKGGVGKTTTAINVGTVAAEDGTALVVETDLATANVSDFLDFGCNPERDPTLHDVLAGHATVEAATYDAPGGLHVLPSGSTIEGFVVADTTRLSDVVGSARDRFDVVVLDTPAGLSKETLLPMALADGVVLVATPRISAVRDVKKTAELVERVDGTTLGLVLSRTGTGNAPPGDRLARFLDVELLGEVPEDDAIPRAQDAGRAVVDHEPDAPSARAYDQIARGLGEVVERTPERVTDLEGWR